jgi:hypothetical protein
VVLLLMVAGGMKLLDTSRSADSGVTVEKKEGGV